MFLPEPNKGMWVYCSPCGHVWNALFLPMEAETAGRCMKRLYCPACGETKTIYMANSEMVTDTRRKALIAAKEAIDAGELDA